MIKICIAEDNGPILKHFVDLLSHEPGFSIVSTARSGKEAVKNFSGCECDVVLMDVEMAERNDGIEATRIITTQNPAVKVIILTIHEDIETILDAFEAGAVDFILKNSSASIIIQAIKAAHDNQSSLEPKVAKIIRNNIGSIQRMRKNIGEIIEIISSLTRTERSLIPSILDNASLRAIAAENYIELSTVKFHIGNILRKFNVKRRKEVAEIIREMGLADLFE
jgi:DNA-binding NarL/FixJ family response regulator